VTLRSSRRLSTCWADLTNIYVDPVVTTAGFGAVGFLDDT
jgi:hypothetical protein